MAMEEAPEKITLANLECVVMPTGEVIFLGETIGWVKDIGEFLTEIPKIRSNHGH